MKSSPRLLMLCIFLVQGVVLAQEEVCNVFLENLEKNDISENQKLTELNEILNSDNLACQYNGFLAKSEIYRKKANIDSASISLDRAMEIAEKLDQDSLFLDASLANVNFFLMMNKSEKADNLLAQCRKKIEKKETSPHWVIYYGKLASQSDSKGEYEEALKYVDSGITKGKKVVNNTLLYSGYLEKAVYCIRLTKYNEAIISIQEGISLIKEQKADDVLKHSLSLAHFYRGVCYERLKEYDLASEDLLKSIDYAREIGDQERIARGYSRLSISLVQLKDKERSFAAIDSVITIAQRLKDYSSLTYGYADKGRALIVFLDDYREAEKWFLSSNALLERDDVQQRTKSFARTLNIAGLVEVYLNTNRYNKALDYIKLYQKEAEKWELLIYKESLADYYGQYHEKTGDYKKALAYHRERVVYKDSITNGEVRVEVADLEKKYETQKKEIEILTLNKEKQEQLLKTEQAETTKYIYGTIALFSIILLVAGSYLFLKIKRQQKKLNGILKALKNSNDKISSVNKVKDRLFSIISHDLRNMLIPFQRGGKLLKHYVDKEDFDMAVTLSQKLQENSRSLSLMLDNLLAWSLEQMNGYSFKAEDLTIFEELLEINTSYLPYATEKNTSLFIDGDADLTTSFDKGAFHVIFRNLIGNAIKYTKNGKIHIRFKKHLDYIIYEVIDTGVGMPEEMLNAIFELGKSDKKGTKGEKGMGIGLNLVRRFVSMNNGSIEVSSKERIGTQFKIKLPAKQSIGSYTAYNEKNLSA